MTADKPKTADTISPNDLHTSFNDGKKWLIVDVREDFERKICKLEGDTHIPLADLPQRFSEIGKDLPIVVYCHSGRRSFAAADFLAQQGFENVFNLEGGVDAWAEQVDSNMERY